MDICEKEHPRNRKGHRPWAEVSLVRSRKSKSEQRRAVGDELREAVRNKMLLRFVNITKALALSEMGSYYIVLSKDMTDIAHILKRTLWLL